MPAGPPAQIAARIQVSTHHTQEAFICYTVWKKSMGFLASVNFRRDGQPLETAEAEELAAMTAPQAFLKTNPPSPASTSTWSPSANSPASRRDASGFSISRWICRFSGRAPYAGS